MSPVRMLICLLVGYLFGNLPSGYLYAKLHGVDIYHAGSGNPGSTNVLRTLGKRAGATVLLMDIAKTVLPIFFLSLYWKPETEDMQSLITLFAGLGAVLGHNYPLLPGIRGGKGVACTGALLLAFDWRLALLLLALFILIVMLTHYVSLGSMIAASCFFLSVLFFGKTGFLPMSSAIYRECCILSFLISGLCVFQHRSNIVRLLNGTENKIGEKKKQDG